MRLHHLLAAAAVALLLCATPALAADTPAADTHAAVADSGKSGAGIGAGLAAGLAVLGAGVGIGLAALGALTGIARQPEAAGKIQVNMIVMAALVEGVCIIALLVISFAMVQKL
jgi:F-type H+-transporting ATPase subunit c